ncbi:MCE family protein [Mycolicibacterium fluoranthenivorans]|uniref:Phospholipid/cholesterol/gamma-HCH transport system substrate-binding protein n=1 Tax=Mycolicibacterium fluoranthenivorans TaxID=258505 RepID=A0A7X5U3E3_9MYCO|nr:MCE family protein [Mycolicibacterium fluoranthenivorans]MCV7358576.1 MCE family protein [Mycolicibacterium fluoranthenivorans]NIH97592.1 phospholipid/cholesterol/gamma-HCH transport system substrate-binding protein [Mycolicibacterium fluoranthenivorans]
MTQPRIRIAVVALFALLLIAGLVVVIPATTNISRTQVVAYFDNTNGLFVGDEVRILGVPVGEIDRIDVEPQRAKVSFWVQDKYKVPADAKAVILAPSLVTARAIQLTPAYTAGPTLADGAVIPRERTAVPVEWDDVRTQLQRLTEMLQPTEPGGTSTLGSLVNTAADNLRGRGASIHDTLVKLSQATSALGDHSSDLFSTLRNLSLLVSALQDSSGLMKQLNQNLASVSGALADDPDEVSNAVRNVSDVSRSVSKFVADNKESLGTTSDKLGAVSQTVTESIDDVKQLLHISPTVLQNFINIYQPAQGTLSGALSTNNFSDPISFICGAVQAASRLNAEQSSKLCVQYLAPIVKNRQMNFFPIGGNPIVGATARPNEVTYSEDWMRPDYVPPSPAAPAAAAPLPAEAAQPDPAAGLPGMMVPAGAGS